MFDDGELHGDPAVGFDHIPTKVSLRSYPQQTLSNDVEVILRRAASAPTGIAGRVASSSMSTDESYLCETAEDIPSELDPRGEGESSVDKIILATLDNSVSPSLNLPMWPGGPSRFQLTEKVREGLARGNPMAASVLISMAIPLPLKRQREYAESMGGESPKNWNFAARLSKHIDYSAKLLTGLRVMAVSAALVFAVVNGIALIVSKFSHFHFRQQAVNLMSPPDLVWSVIACVFIEAALIFLKGSHPTEAIIRLIDVDSPTYLAFCKQILLQMTASESDIPGKDSGADKSCNLMGDSLERLCPAVRAQFNTMCMSHPGVMREVLVCNSPWMELALSSTGPVSSEVMGELLGLLRDPGLSRVTKYRLLRRIVEK